MKVSPGGRLRASGPFGGRLYLLACLSLFVTSVTAAEAHTKAYVVHPGANVVTVIDTTTAMVVGTVPVGAHPTLVVTSRDGSRAYVANLDADTISVIDTALDVVVATISVGDAPSYLAASPDGSTLYVMTASGSIDVVDTARQSVSGTIAVGSSGALAITPDGARLYIAAGLVYVVDTAAQAVVQSFAAETASVAGIATSATDVVVSPDGSRAFVATYFFDTRNGFGAGGNLVVIDTTANTIAGTIGLGSIPGAIALTPDGSRAYVGIQSTFVNTGYGSGFFPGRHAYAIDTETQRIGAVIDFGADGSNWTQQNTPSGIGVTPDRRAIYVSIPRLSTVAVVDLNTHAVSSRVSVTAGPRDLAVTPDADVTPEPYAVAATDDSAALTTVGGTAVADVLANDTFGGFAATTAQVMLTQQSSTSYALTLDTGSGAVNADAGIAVGVHTLVYRACEIALPSNCDEATVTVSVREPYIIDAVNDSASSQPGRQALASVLANDTLNGAPATAATVTLSVVASTDPNVRMNTGTGSVFVFVGTVPGTQTLTYRICEIASPTNCDQATVTITVTALPIDAVNDAVSIPRSGGNSFVSVLANDTFAGAAATLARVRLSQVSSTHAGIALNVATGIVSVAAGTPVGSYALQYRICEIATPTNCDGATVAVTVTPLQIVAVNDSARGSSKQANTVLASVLTNDRLGSAPATPANVRLAFVSLTPANNQIRLDLADGSVDVLGKTNSGIYSLIYEICEAAMPTNCARATARVDLSGK